MVGVVVRAGIVGTLGAVVGTIATVVEVVAGVVVATGVGVVIIGVGTVATGVGVKIGVGGTTTAGVEFVDVEIGSVDDIVG